jgi:hypothetical protein
MKTLKILSFMFIFSALVISCGDGAEATTDAVDATGTEVMDDAAKATDEATAAAKAVADKAAAEAKAAADAAAAAGGEAVDGAVDAVKEAADEHAGHEH